MIDGHTALSRVIVANLTDSTMGLLAEVLEETACRDCEYKIVVAESVGSAAFDTTATTSVVDLAEVDDVGILVDF